VKQAARLVLSVADVLTKEGCLPEALDALKEAVQLDPDNPEIREKLAAAIPVDQIAPPVQEVAPEIVEASAPVSEVAAVGVPDQTAEEPAAPVPAEATEEPLPLESFFEELRGKIARDQETRAREQLDRGLEHLADNRVDDAIASLEEAARMPAMRFEASSHLARISLGRGDLQAAADWMERALKAPAPAVGDRLEIMYDLADTLARQGEASRAMALFMEVDSESSGYRDVRERIAHLSHTEIGKS
jgi:tetratricopeptide (TPR) repeat protein